MKIFSLLILSQLITAMTFKVENLALTWKLFKEESRNPIFADFQDQELDQGLNLDWDVSLNNFYFRNEILSYTLRSKETRKVDQFRYIHWRPRLGVRVYFFDFEYEHLSGHHFDRESKIRFPVQDSFNIRINFLK